MDKPMWKTKSFWAQLIAVISAFVLNAIFPDPPPAVMGDDFDPSLPKGDILTWIIFGQALLTWLSQFFRPKATPDAESPERAKLPLPKSGYDRV